MDSKLINLQNNLLNHRQGQDWTQHSVVVRETRLIGLGLVAIDFIPKGSTVILFGGYLLTWKEFQSLPDDLIDYPYQVADNLFYGLTREEDIGIGERINHSCNPTTGFTSEMKLVAIRDILPGEDVTMDYATCTSTDDYFLACKCGEKNCRGTVTGSDWLIPDIQDRLKNYFQPYLKEKIAAQQKYGLKSALSSMFRYLANVLSH